MLDEGACSKYFALAFKPVDLFDNKFSLWKLRSIAFTYNCFSATGNHIAPVLAASQSRIFMKPSIAIHSRWLTAKIDRLAFLTLPALGIISLFAICAATATAQTCQSRFSSCAVEPADSSTRKGTILVAVTARPKQGELHWELKKYPDLDEEIRIDDPQLKQAIKDFIQAEFKKPPATPPRPMCNIGQAADIAGLCSFDSLLNAAPSLRSFNLAVKAPPELDEEPKASDQEQECAVELCVTYRPAEALPAKVEIEIKTAPGNASPSIPSREHTLGETDPAKYQQNPAGAIPVKLFYAQADIKNMMAGAGIDDQAEAEKRVVAELLKVADRVFEVARSQQLLDEQGKVKINAASAESVCLAVRHELAAIYDLSRLRGGGVSWAKFEPPLPQLDRPRSTWIIPIRGLQIVRGIHIDVVPDDLDRQYKRTRIGERLSQKRGEEEKKLNEKFRGKLSARPGTIVTTTAVNSDATKSDAEERLANEVKSFEGARSKPYVKPDRVEREKPLEPNLIYRVLRKLPPERAINLKGGGSFSPEDRFLAQASIDEFNNLRFGEKATLDFSRGNQTQKVRFELSRAFKEWEGQSGFRLRDVGVKIQYFRDDDLRLGNLTQEEIALRETGSNARISFGYDSFDFSQYLQADDLSNKDRKRTHWSMLGDLSLDYRDVNIPDHDKLITITGLGRNLLPKPRTQASSLSLNLKTAMSRDYRELDKAGLGRVSLSLESRLRKGLDLFGADYQFSKAMLIARGEIFFGQLTPLDFFLRYVRGVGTSSDNTPVFDLFRLGGPQNVRGIEEGEFIGRRLTYEQTEFGVNAVSLWRFFRKKKPNNASDRPANAEASSEEQPQFDFSKLYLKGFFDRARISDATSFGQTTGGNPNNPIPFLLDRRATGYGFAVELMNLSAAGSSQSINLSIGYARSPQSRLHRSGVMFTGVSFNF